MRQIGHKIVSERYQLRSAEYLPPRKNEFTAGRLVLATQHLVPGITRLAFNLMTSRIT
jgi:hypothetical protein